MKEHLSLYRIEYLLIGLLVVFLSLLWLSFFAYVDSRINLSCEDLKNIEFKPMPERCVNV